MDGDVIAYGQSHAKLITLIVIRYLIQLDLASLVPSHTHSLRGHHPGFHYIAECNYHKLQTGQVDYEECAAHRAVLVEHG